MKKYFFLLVAVAVCGICAAYDFTAVSPSGHTLYYTIDGSNVKVAPEIYNPSSLITEVYETSPVGDLVIPESVNHEGVDYTVSAISAYAFSWCKGLTSVFIPASVTTIEDGAFSQCSGIKYLEVPGTVTSIGSGAFAMVRHVEYYGSATDSSNWGTLSLNGVVEGNLAYSDESKTQLNACIDTDENGTVSIPESVKVISRYAFFELPSLVSIAVPNTVDSLGMGVFANCENLVSATLPAKIKLIHGQLFAGCISLKSFVVPDSVEKIYLSAFDGCESLEEVTIGYNTKSIASYAFYDCHSLKTIRTHAPVPPTFFEEDTFDEVPKDQVEVIVPGGCLAAYQAAWNEFSHFKEVWDPKYNVFPYEHNGQTLYYRLKTDTAVNETYAICSYPILFPTTVETLWEGFRKPVGDVEIPASVEFNGQNYSVLDIGRCAFAYCDEITGVTVPEGVFRIGNSAFYYCTHLQSVSLPSTITEMDPYIFGKDSALVSVNIPEGLTAIPDYMFYGCVSLPAITLPQSLNRIGDHAFRGCIHLESVNMPDHLDYLGSFCFADDSTLTSITIPEGISVIKEWSFGHCHRLTSLVVPDGVQVIEDQAIAYCDRLQSVVLPESLDSIGAWVFYLSDAINEISLGGAVPPIAHDYAFSSYNATLNVPVGAAEAYRQHDVWSRFANIVEGTEGIDNPSAANNAAQKIVVNGHLLIVKGEKTYTTTGALVK